MTQKELRNLALGLVIGFSSLSALATVTLPFSFKSGDPIRSGEVNANFSSLKAFAAARSNRTVTASRLRWADWAVPDAAGRAVYCAGATDGDVG